MAIFWYNGPYNLILAFDTDDPQDIIDKIKEVTDIKKLRIRRPVDNWIHPPYIFKEVPDVNTEFKRVSINVDESDKKILNVLDENPLASFVELSTKTNLAAQTIKRRMDYMERSGVILAYEYFPEIWLCGREVISINLIVSGKKETDKVIKHLLKIPEVGNVWEYDDEWNLNFVLWVKDQLEVNKIVNKIMNNFDILDMDISTLAAFTGK